MQAVSERRCFLKVKLRKFVAFVLSASLLVFSAYKGHELWSNPVAQFLVEASVEQIEKNVASLQAKHLTKAHVEGFLLDELNKPEMDWIVLDSVLKGVEDRALSINPEILASVEHARSKEFSVKNQAFSCGQCAWDPLKCPHTAVMVCGMAVNISPTGDLLGLSRAGYAWASGEEIDKVDAALSAVGLGAAVATVASGGAAAPIKGGVGLVKFAHKADMIPPKVQSSLKTAASEGIAWSDVGKVRSLDDVSALLRGDKIKPLQDMGASMGQLSGRIGVAPSLWVLERSRSVDEFVGLSRVGQVAGDKTAALVRLAGNSRVARAGMRWSSEAWMIVSSLVAGLGLLVTSLGSLFGSFMLKRLRKKL